MAESVSFSAGSAGLANEPAFGGYHDLYAPVADAVRLGEAFSARVDAHRLNEAILFDRRLRDVGHVRTAKRVARNGFDHFTMQIAVEGGFRVSTDNGEAAVKTGEIALIDMSRPMATKVETARTLTLSIPRREIESAASRMQDLHGAVLRKDRSILLSEFLLSFLRNAGNYGMEDRVRVGRVALDLAALALSDRRSDGQAATGEAADAVCRQRARRFIDANPAASPEAVAAAIGRSRSALYRAFKASGGVARYIRSRRLARLRALLSTPGETRRIGELAYDCGFSSDSDAARAFRSEFGLTPGEFRSACREPASVPTRAEHMPTELLAGWWDRLR